MNRLQPFRPRAVPLRSEELGAFISATVAELERVLVQWQQLLEHGPVPGAYVPLSIDRPGPVSAGSGLWRLKAPCELRLAALSVGVKAGSGEVTVEARSDGVSLLLAPAATVSGLALITQQGDLAQLKVARGATLSLDVAATSGTPTELAVLLLFKNAGQI